MTNLPSLPPVTDDDVMAYLSAFDANPTGYGPVRAVDARVGLNAYRSRLIANGHATEPTAPAALVVLPTVDEIADVLRTSWSQVHSTVAALHRTYAENVLDLLESRVPHWVKIEPGTLVKAGTRYRTEGKDWAWETSQETDWTPYAAASGTMRTYIDPRTVPAEPEDPGLAVVRDWMADAPTADDDDARDLLARIDAARADS